MSSRSDSVVDKNCFVKVSIIFFSPRQESGSRCLTCAGHDDSFSIDPHHPFNATRNTRSSGLPVSRRFLPWAETGGGNHRGRLVPCLVTSRYPRTSRQANMVALSYSIRHCQE